MENLKRKRERTFEYSEKSVFLEIVTKHYNVIESKKTYTVDVKTKNAEWVKIAESFAAASSIYPRDVLTLKTLWENLKRKAKLAIAAQADNHYGTGGGKAKILNDPLVDIIVGLIRPHVKPFNNIYDDNNDDIPTKTISNFYNNIVEEDATEEIVINDFGKHKITNDDWSQYNPTMLKSPISAALRQPT
ncbi:hypothetical protein AGLY_017138 [Aphis glycines]|uniref:Regulatory protein zeste n=1 Tax=Aphis glycines TaxID=307491 RepID=A0A6G0SXU3_APHGL|nr:hypothetical protein AGLY_017138 [Aphis glycines]